MDWRARVSEALPAITGEFRRDADIQAELADHCAAREADLREQGVDPREAERLVLRELHETARRRAALQREARAMHSTTGALHRSWLGDAWQDGRYAIRVLRRTPGATTAAILTLALTIGAATAIFSVVQAVLLRPLPYPDAGRLVRVWEVRPRDTDHNPVSAGNVLAWSEQAQSFSAMGTAQFGFHAALTGDGTPQKVDAAAITPSTLDVLQVRPALGHSFAPGLMVAGQPAEVLISDALWRERFGADRGVVGKVLHLDGDAIAVAGVMPRGFAFPSADVDVWFPRRFVPEDRDSWRSHNYQVFARLAPGATVASAQTEMTGLAARLARDHPTDMAGWGVNVVPAHADAVRHVRPLLLVLLGVVIVVLIIACANLATLQLARASRRGVEMAVRIAVGAGRARLVRQLLTESLIVAAAGGVLGALLLAVSLPAILAAAPADIPFLETVRLDGAVLSFAVVVTIVCAVLVGLAPAMQAWRARVQPSLASARTAGGAPARTRQVLVAAQLALTLVLLVGALLLVRSFWKLQQVDYGFDPDQLLTVSIDLPPARYRENAAQVRFYDALLERLRALPAVRAAAGTTAFPGEGADMTFSFAIAGRPSSNPSGREDPVALQGVTPGYFSTLGIRLLEGRAIELTDTADTLPVLVINEALARKHWPAGDALGARIRFNAEDHWRRIVGVVADTHDDGLDLPPPPTIYLPLAQRAANWNWMTWQTLVVRTTSDPMTALPSVRAAIWSLDRDLPLLEARTMTAAFAENDAQRRFATALVGAFAVLALALGMVGVFGVLSCAMSERRREIGVRLALGAQPARVAAAMIRSTLVFAAGGVVAGLAAAVAVTRFLSALLFQIDPIDPVTFALATIPLVAVAVLAAWVPARRAARLNPLTVLRES
ncbi:MAG TPA: ABC transporter permease [Vicinamibacterales bacterium]|nr:ABC transporter permease [Vicinamibacterales bacterium]